MGLFSQGSQTSVSSAGHPSGPASPHYVLGVSPPGCSMPLTFNVFLRKTIFFLPKPGFFLLASCLLHSGVTYPQSSTQSHISGTVLFLPSSSFQSFSTVNSAVTPGNFQSAGTLLTDSANAGICCPLPCQISPNRQDLEKCLCSRSTPQALQLQVVDLCCLQPPFLWSL